MVKIKQRRMLSRLLIGIISISVIILGYFYLQFIAKCIYEEGTNHLIEVYSQVNHSFSSFLEQNEANLLDWDSYIQEADESTVAQYIGTRQAYWKFSEFYFLASDGTYIMPTGETGSLDLGEESDRLFVEKQYIMTDDMLENGRAFTVFAVPVSESTYHGFSYSAVALSYTNADIIRSLNVSAFSGESKCFIIKTDGSVVLSTQQGTSVFNNYLTYLDAGSDLSDKQLADMQKDWKQNGTNAIRCNIGKESYYIAYQPINYLDYVLLGVAPEKISSASLVRIQKATIDVLVKIFLLIGITLVSYIIYYDWKRSRKSAIELLYRDLMYNTLANSIDIIFIMLDKETWKIDYISPNIQRLTGISAAQVKEDFSVLNNSKEDFAAVPMHGSRSWERKRIHKGTEEQRWYHEIVYCESIAGVEKYIIVMSDCTQVQKMNSDLREALATAKNANEVKSHFLSNMSHDIRTPMNAIIGFTVLLEKDVENAKKVREYTRKISSASQHLLNLINDILDMSKIESGKTSLNMEPFSLPDIIDEMHTILDPQAKAKQQAFHFHVKGHPTERLIGDKLRVNQVLINLLSNAIKYTPQNGQIDFTIQEIPSEKTQYAYLRFTVQDNGIGMSPEFMKTLFEPFTRELNSTTSGIQGTGLGMAITKNLVDLMGGIIQVSSELGKGSTFIVELAFKKADPLADPLNDVSFWEKYGISRILVVDNHEDDCYEIQDMIQEAGVTVVCVSDGAAALEEFHQAEAEPFQAAIVSWEIPDNEGGEIIRQIRKAAPETLSLLVLTANDWEDIEKEARAAGADAFILEPFFISSFRRAIESLLPIKSEEENENSNHELSLDGMLFLVAEDNELNAEILSEMLDMEGASCELASNGREALEMFLKSEPKYYDMILMDVQMPIMNGYEATQQIRASAHPEAKTMPIIAMTANAFAEDVQNAHNAGMDEHVSKPLDMERVIKIITALKNKQEQ